MPLCVKKMDQIMPEYRRYLELMDEYNTTGKISDIDIIYCCFGALDTQIHIREDGINKSYMMITESFTYEEEKPIEGYKKRKYTYSIDTTDDGIKKVIHYISLFYQRNLTNIYINYTGTIENDNEYIVDTINTIFCTDKQYININENSEQNKIISACRYDSENYKLHTQVAEYSYGTFVKHDKNIYYIIDNMIVEEAIVKPTIFSVNMDYNDSKFDEITPDDFKYAGNYMQAGFYKKLNKHNSYYLYNGDTNSIVRLIDNICDKECRGYNYLLYVCNYKKVFRFQI